MRDAFLVLGSQYYAHARYSATEFYLPVSATLFHHSIEMLLKGYLIKFTASSELKKIGHNLVDLWDLFKDLSSIEHLSKFDESIQYLDQIELLRYPNAIVDKGYVLHISLGTPSIPIDLPGTKEVPQYSISVSDLDAIIQEIYRACEVSPKPYFNAAPTLFRNVLPWDF